MATIENFELHVAEDKTLRYSVLEADNATAQVITGWALTWELLADPGDTAALLSKTVGAGVTITSGVGGIASVAVADTETDDLPAGDYYHALWRTDAGAQTLLSHGVVDLQRITPP